MLFDSPIYVVFLVLVVLAYWRLSHRTQNVFLLLASYFFYGWWDWRFLALMIRGTAADFFIARNLVPGRPKSNRKKWLVLSLILNFRILGGFKYFNFFADSLAAPLNLFGIHDVPFPIIRMILPPSISLYHFEELACFVYVYT